MIIKKPNVAGTFYPEDKNELNKLLNILFSNSKKLKTNQIPKALISPHAGIVYSGLVASAGYNLIKQNKNINRIMILGPSHYVPISFLALLDANYYQTPLGKISIDAKTQKELNEQAPQIFKFFNQAHNKEHSVEVQLIFLQKIFKNFSILPIVVGQTDNYKKIALILNSIMDKNTIIIASSDLSHYLPQNIANTKDEISINAILSKNSSKIKKETDACGIYPILILNELANLQNLTPKLIDYITSGDITGDYSQVVGYASIAYFPND